MRSNKGKKPSLISVLLKQDANAPKTQIDSDLDAADHSKSFGKKAIFNVNDQASSSTDTFLQPIRVRMSTETKEESTQAIIPTTMLEEKTDYTGWTPLMVAVHKGNYNAIQWLIQKGNIDIDHQAKPSNVTALMLAVMHAGTYKSLILAELLKLTPKLELQDAQGMTVVMHAARQKDSAALKTMLSVPNIDAIISLNDKNNKTALSYATEGHEENFSILVVRKSSVVTQYHFAWAAKNNRWQDIEAVFEKMKIPDIYYDDIINNVFDNSESVTNILKIIVKRNTNSLGDIQCALLRQIEKGDESSETRVLAFLKEIMKVYPEGRIKQNIRRHPYVMVSSNQTILRALPVFLSVVQVNTTDAHHVSRRRDYSATYTDNVISSDKYDLFSEALFEKSIQKKYYRLCKYLLSETKASHWIYQHSYSQGLVDKAKEQKDTDMLVYLYESISREHIKTITDTTLWESAYPDSYQPAHRISYQNNHPWIASIPKQVIAYGDTVFLEFLHKLNPTIVKAQFPFSDICSSAANDNQVKIILACIDKMVALRVPPADLVALVPSLQLWLNNQDPTSETFVADEVKKVTGYVEVFEKGEANIYSTLAPPTTLPKDDAIVLPGVTQLLAEAKESENEAQQLIYQANEAYLVTIRKLQAAYYLAGGEGSRQAAILNELKAISTKVNINLYRYINEFIKFTVQQETAVNDFLKQVSSVSTSRPSTVSIFKNPGNGNAGSNATVDLTEGSRMDRTNDSWLNSGAS